MKIKRLLLVTSIPLLLFLGGLWLPIIIQDFSFDASHVMLVMAIGGLSWLGLFGGFAIIIFLLKGLITIIGWIFGNEIHLS